MSVKPMSDAAAAVVFGGTPVSDHLDSPLFHQKLMAADTAIPTRARLDGIRALLAVVEAEYAATDAVIAESVTVVKAALADINDPALFRLDPA